MLFLIWFQDVLDCDKSVVSGMGKTENYDPLCHVISDTSGKFTFPCLVPGDYYLVSCLRITPTVCVQIKQGIGQGLLDFLLNMLHCNILSSVVSTWTAVI